MQAIIFTFILPMIPFFIWKSYSEKKTVSIEKSVSKYIVYTGLMLLISSAAMVLFCDGTTSFLEKTDKSPTFLLKYLLIEVVAGLVIAVSEWMYVTKKLAINVKWAEYRNTKLGRFTEKVIVPAGIYLVAAFVVLLNVSLMFDGVLWGDEAFSVNTAEKSIEGILQVMWFWDNHPPLYYFWLKLLITLFGNVGPVYHLSSIIPFAVGILFAVTLFRKHFGKIPTAFFIIISGMASGCLAYNQEVRMYELAFLGVVGCCYCVYRIFSGNKVMAWIGLVLWALLAAYSHYYALVAVGIMLFITLVAAQCKYHGKTWIKGTVAMLAFIAGYSPWFSYLFGATKNVKNNWWMTELLGLNESLQMVMGEVEMQKIIMPLFFLIVAVLLLTESSWFEMKRAEEKTTVYVKVPTIKTWSDKTYTVMVYALTVLGTIIAAYVLCMIMGPILAQRYLYPLSAVTFITLVVGSSELLELLKKLGEKLQHKWMVPLGKVVLLAMLCVLFVIGLQNYRAFKATVTYEKQKTEEFLSVVGTPDEDTVMVSNGVKHLGWTVLYHYFPNNEIINGRYDNAEIQSNKFWYFTPNYLTDQELKDMTAKGLSVVGAYGDKQIAQYPFVLYYIERVPKETKAQ